MNINAPVLYEHKAFDAFTQEDFTFSWNGNQAFQNRLVICNNTTGKTVYDHVMETMVLKHTLPAGTLKNGEVYCASLKVMDQTGAESPFSEKILFSCFTVPNLTFTNIEENQIIRNASFEVFLSYSQPEGEQLQFFQVSLYNSERNCVFSTGIRYDTGHLSAMLTNLNDNSRYYLQAVGETIHGMKANSGMIPVEVDYLYPNLYALLSLENIGAKGQIRIESRMKQIEGHMEPEGTAPVFKDHEKIDLTKDGIQAVFDKGFCLDANYTIAFHGCQFTRNKTLASWTNGKDTASLTMRWGTYLSNQNQEKAYIELHVTCALGHYYCMSNYFNIPARDTLLTIWVRCIRHTYQLEVMTE